jgi:predicted transcriptional regulator of viral defense system
VLFEIELRRNRDMEEIKLSIKKYIDILASNGKYFFTVDEALKATGVSKIALNSSLRRLKKKNELASPLKGFFIIIPPEYRSLRSLPPEQFIDDLMKHLKIPYYVALLSAAQYYGAAHQKPQYFQVIIPGTRRSIEIGRVKIIFIRKSDATNATIRQFNTPRGYVSVATPEIIAVDLVIFPHQSGGISDVFEILSELSEHIEREGFLKAIRQLNMAPPIQRLGYFFDLLELDEFSQLCNDELRKYQYIRKVKLDPQSSTSMSVLNKKWNLIINIDLETEHDT